MSSTFPATLYDRAQLKQYEAIVKTEPGSLSIEFAAENGAQTLIWLQRDVLSVQEQPGGGLILQKDKLFLDVPDAVFREAFDRSFPGHSFYKTRFLDKIGLKGCLFALVMVVAPLVAAWYWLLPVAADRAARQIPIETERQFGDAMYKALSVGYEVDSNLTRLVQNFYDKTGYGGDYNMRITVVHEPVVNAFALPGGQIVVFDSIIGLMDAPEQLAALLAHEASHIQLRHSTRMIFKQLSNSLIFSMLLGDYGALSTVISQQGAELAGLSYSRSLEIEADDHGLELMQTAGVEQEGMPDLFEKMESSGASGKVEAPDFLSTHPALSERIKRCREQIGQKKHPSGRLKPEWMSSIWEEIKKSR